MSRLISIDPSAIQSIADLNLIRPFIGQTKSFFLAQTPKNWIQLLETNAAQLDQNVQKKLREFLVKLKDENSIYRVDYRDKTDDFVKNAINHLKEDKHLQLVIANLFINESIKSFADLNDEDLEGPKSFHGQYDTDSIWHFLEIYAKTAGRLAIVSRHNNLFDAMNRPSRFSKYLRKLVEGVSGSGCHEIVIYTTRDEIKYSEQISEKNLKESLAKILQGIKLPTYGVRMIVCDENANFNKTDLHERVIVTNHVVLRLSDDLGGRTKSQSISVETDMSVSKKLRLNWFDMEHGLSVFLDVTLKNKVLS